MARPFSSGSRQPPDPIDQYLMQYNIYRKHTARDPSSLFRVVSEHLFGCQNYHEFVREKCVNYMTQNKQYFKNSVDCNIDDYLRNLSRNRTSGTLLELKALAYLFSQNVVLYEEFNTGNWFVNEPSFQNKLLVFATAENHFDSVFQQEYIEDVAFCQSLVYELLYSYVYKLPDVVYAVERMLHDSPDSNMIRIYNYDGDDYPERICLADGRVFLLDRPEYTECILDNYLLCHFHNKHFEKLRFAMQNELNGYEQQSHTDAAASINKTLKSLLPEKYISCVRQLLSEGITPFPYKVAKALDPDIYRNIEYDSWSDSRKEMRLRHWNKNLQIGEKCNVRLSNKTYMAYIQEMAPNRGACQVYVESMAEKRCVPYSAIMPFSMDSIKPWQSNNRYGRYGGRKQHVRCHYDIGHDGSGSVRGQSRPMMKCILPSPPTMPGIFNHYESYGGKRPKGGIRTSKRNRKSPEDLLQCQIDIEMLSSSTTPLLLGDHVKGDVPFDISQLTSLSNFKPMPCDLTVAPMLVQNNSNQPPVRHGNANNRSVQSHSSSSSSNNNNHKNINSKHKNTSTAAAASAAAVVGENTMEPKQLSDIQTQPVATIKVEPDYKPEPEARHSGGNFNAFHSNEFTPNIFDGGAAAQQYHSGTDMMYGGYRTERHRYFYGSQGPHHSVEHSGWQHSMPVNSYGFCSSSAINNNVQSIPVKRRDLLQQQYPVTFEAMPSLDVRGSDIPSDTGTVRFFYNLGHEYFNQLQAKHSIQAISQLARCSSGCGEILDTDNAYDMSFSDNEALTTLGNDFAKIKLEKPNNQKNDTLNRRITNWRGGGNKRQYSRQSNGSSTGGVGGSSNGNKNFSNGGPPPPNKEAKSNSKDYQSHVAVADVPPGVNDNQSLLQQSLRSDRSTPSAIGASMPPLTGEVHQLSPYIQMAPPQYQQFIPYYPMEGGEQSMYMPYGIYPSGPALHAGYPQYVAPPISLASTGEMDPIDGSKYAYYQPHSAPAGPQPLSHPLHIYPLQHQQPIAIAPQGFWYPPPQPPPPTVMPVSPQPTPGSPSTTPPT